MNGMLMKRVALRFLLICNLLLLAVIAVFAVVGALRTSEQSRQTAALLNTHGVSLSGDVYRALLEDKTAYTLRTDVDAQETFCSSVLGDAMDSDASSGGNITWTSAQGDITWDIEGTVSGTADLSSYGAMTSADDAKRVITKLLRKADVNMKQTAIEAADDNGALTVRVQEGISGRNLTDYELKFVVDQAGMATISGQWCFGDPEPVKLETLNDSTPADVLLALIRVDSTVTQVTAAQQVYVVSNRSGGRFTIYPYWKLTTDQGEFLIDPLTGEEAPDKTEQSQNTTTLPADDGTDGTNAVDSTDPAVTDPGTGDTNTTTPEDSTDTTDSPNNSEDTTVVPGNDTWDSSQGTNKTDPELPDANGVYG